ncbi:MAG TPA: carbohydrate binding family 9 domain-containing protein, partial [Gemmatimonadales bacterium]|nr:carbohydrate binding family 9 domain-containing protein [Gemmatimonadales bacterium]
MDKAANIRWTIARRRRRAALLLPTLLVVGSPLAAQGVDPGELKEAMAVRFSGGAIRVDGRLDDSAWGQAVFFSDFRQRDPVYGAQPSDRTEVAFLYDDAAIYVGARMHSSEPDRIPASLTRHDGFGRAEHLTVSFDPFLDRRTAFSFTVTSGNGRRDFVHTSDSDDFRSRDYTWNPVWEGKAVRDSLGWTLEMRIPLSQLRFPGQPVHVW